jgi:(R,R)-butanediol dehydrogenase/meso-butanediol dehydrogenase/diacetyl reductase
MSRLAPGESAFISGAGPIGLSAIASAKAAGATTIIVSEISNVRRQKAEELGATHVLNPSDTDVLSVVRDLTHGLGTDVALEAAGVEPALDIALQATRKAGRFVQIALWGSSPHVNMMMNVMKETEMRFAVGYSFVEEFPELLSLMSAGIIEPKKLITDVISLDDVVPAGFEELLKNRDTHAKILVDVNA